LSIEKPWHVIEMMLICQYRRWRGCSPTVTVCAWLIIILSPLTGGSHPFLGGVFFFCFAEFLVPCHYCCQNGCSSQERFCILHASWLDWHEHMGFLPKSVGIMVHLWYSVLVNQIYVVVLYNYSLRKLHAQPFVLHDYDCITSLTPCNR